VLHNGPLASNNFTDFYWAWTGTGGGNPGMEQSLNPPAPGFTTNGQEHAFTLFGTPTTTLPEPASWVLVSAGAAFLGFLRRKN